MKKHVRKNKVTRHHIMPKSRYGGNEPENIWYLPRYKHDAWHALFGLRTIDEAIGFLKEIKKRKEEERYGQFGVLGF